MGAFLVVLRKDLLRRLRAPLASIVLLLFPILFSLLIGLTFGGQGEKMAPIRLVLVDEDGGFLARMLRSSFNQDSSATKFDLQEADLPAATRMVEEGKVSALLRIPAGFTDSVLAQKTVALELVKNPAESIYPRIAEQYVKVLAQLGGSAVRLLGPPVQEIRSAIHGEGWNGAGATDAFVSRVSVAISRRMSGVGRYIDPPAIRLEEVKPEAEKSAINSPFQIMIYVLPGMSVYALLMLALVSLQDFQREGARGTLARQFVAPIPFRTVVAGKVGASWLLALIATAILSLITLLSLRTGVSLAGFLVLSVAFASAATGFAAFIQSLARTERAGSVIGSILVMIMSMAGGSFVPLDDLPPFIQRIAPFTLNYWGVDGYRRLMGSSASLADIGRHVVVLFALAGVLTSIAAMRFTRRYGTGG